ncbi:hypothetical protein A1507_13795 [Methylomonas koyamae]|uniref:HupE/UreJ protein n=1 Tax=Methylomonas koyamae TaxID=702114 RepID=A0A177NBV7_9GAMM|nr:HupE/UreJ family protein [Methylomonas koyamae]OAI15497.1 hypothetical protein A1507_13795 [Methylomonas koyamae]
MKFARFNITRWLLLGWLLPATAAFAHRPGISSLEIALNSEGTAAKITFALQDIEAFAPMDSDLDAEVSDAEREAAKPAIAKLLSEQLHLAADGRDLSPSAPGTVEFDDQNNARLELHYAAEPLRSLRVESSFLSRLPDGHQQYLSVKSVDGKVLAEKMLNKQEDQVSLPLAGAAQAVTPQSAWVAFGDFFKLGIEHILTGYDHLLFLFALLAVTHSFWPALKIITFFTIAHSITLAFAGLNIFELPSDVVEPLIAATIVYVSLENLIRGERSKGRHWLTFGFGLIHGFGFAGVLREMDITAGDGGILLPLASFNLGIESGQIAVAVIVLPMIWWLNNNLRTAERFLKGCSLMVCLMGSYWLLERTVLLSW